MDDLDNLLGEPDADYSDLEPEQPVRPHRSPRAARPPRVPKTSTRLVVRDAAELLGIGRRTLDRAIAAMPEHRKPERLPGRGTGKRVRYVWESEADLRKWWSVVTTIATTTGTVVRMERPPSKAVRKPRRGAAVLDDDQPVDWDAVIRQR